MNNGAFWLVNTKPQNKYMLCQISPRKMCNPCDYAMKISCRYHRLLIYHVKRTTKIDGMGPFNVKKYTIKGGMHIFNVNMLLFRSRTTEMSSSDFQKGEEIANNICHFELNRFIDVEHEIGNLIIYLYLVI